MELKQLLTPWNWFKKEEEQSLPVRIQNNVASSSHPFEQLHRDMDRLVHQFFHGLPVSPLRKEYGSPWGGLLMPHVDIREGTKQYTISVEVPGVDQKAIDLTIEDGTLMIRGEKRYEQEDHDQHSHRIERSYGSFQRTISLPPDADENHIDAKFKDGVLTISISKTPGRKVSGRQIEIRS